MSFKDEIQKDLGVFINMDEFAEVHNVNGQDIPVLIDADLLKGRQRMPADLYHAAAGVFIEQITVYARLSDLGERPVIGQRLYLDDELYLVANCNEQMGILEITLEANRS
ncbi:hypothetical protein [Brevibacillus sp. H7]|uniref:hypothetical protein n=1 Tax=Brevibacillus sp. H7 TaxID=3349138 RepID=UPI00381E51A1